MRVLAVATRDPFGTEGIRLAVRLTAGSPHEVLALGVVEGGDVGYAMGAGIGPGPDALLLPSLAVAPDGAHELEAAIRESVADLGPVPRHVIAEGQVRKIVPRAIDEADPDLLVVPGLPPRGRLHALLLGDPWAGVAASSPVPVVLARPGGGGPPTVLVVLEDPRPGAEAVRAALDLPLPETTRMVVLGLLPPGDDDGTVRHRARMVRRIDVARSMLRRAGRDTAVMIRERSTSAVVLEAADRVDADLIVVASSHGVGAGRLVAAVDELTRRSPRSVMVVPSVAMSHQRRTRRDRRAREPFARRAGSRSGIAG